MTKKNIIPVVVLSAICLAAALLLSLINMLTSERIKENEAGKISESLSEVLPEGKNFEPFELDDKYPAVIKLAYKADGGFVFQAEVKGYKDGLKILCGISSDGKIAGVTHIETNETFGLEGELNKAYIGETLDSAELIIATGATPNSATSKAYFEAIKASLQAFAIAGGAEVDTRTPEQILKDNCNAALGTTDVEFTKWFKTESISGVDAVYESGEGRVYVIGESFVGIKDGMVVTENVSEDARTAALSADNTVAQSTLTKITELPAGLPANFVEAYVTASGNYVITAKGAGYGIDGHWNTSGEYIRVKVSISADGKIIDTATVYHSETEDIGGAALSNPDFVGAFEGKGKDDYSSVAGVSGATMTSDGYKGAIGVAFDAFEILKGDG